MTSIEERTTPQDLLRKIRRIEIRVRRILNTAFLGEYHSVFRGRGMEFSEVREYVPGDDIRAIDWNVTARLGYPYVKQFVEERELTVVLVVDVSASGNYGSTGPSKKEIATEVAALLAFSAIRNNDKVGLVAFSDRVEKYVPPRKGRQHVLRVIRELLYLQPSGRGTRIAEALAYVDRLQKRRSVVFLISDFLDSGYERALQLVGRRHDLVALALNDPRERQLPAVGFVSLYDAERGTQALVDTGSPKLRRFFAARRREEEARRAAFFRQQGIDAISIDISRSYMEPLIQFFQARLRRSR